MATQDNQPLVLKEEWEVKEDKFTSSAQNLTITFNKATDEITLLVNNEVYKKVKVKDALTGNVKFHDAVGTLIQKFNLWGFDAK
jgi:adenosyl cobinamide kinase/adenosyl cobinamide phosphate guanylyltransferase